MKLTSWFICAAVLTLAYGCSDSDADADKPAPDAGSPDSANTGGSSGTGGATGTGGAAEDPRKQAASYATDTIACTTDADCCVVFDMCQNAGYVVAATNKDKVAALLSGAPQDTCTNCIPPAIQVKCTNSVCTGAKIECTGNLFNEGMQNHCGALVLPAGCTEVPATKPGLPSPGLQPQTILGCGAP